MNAKQENMTLRKDFESSHGFWNVALEDLLTVDPCYFIAYDRLLRVSSARGALSPIQRELICVAVNAQVTYLNRSATEHHVRQAKTAGASTEEIVETLQLAASLGTHSMLVGVPIAHEVFEELGIAVPIHDVGLDEQRQALKKRFIESRKYWTPNWDVVLAYAPEYFEAYLDLSRIPWDQGPLEEYFKELVYIAIDVATTHLFTAGIRTHVKKAIEYGATPEQIIDVVTLASNIGIDTTLMGVSHVTAERRG